MSIRARQGNGGFRSWFAIVVLGVLCACGSRRETNIDLLAYLGDMERLCAGLFAGTVQDDAGNNDDHVTYQPCEHGGEAYRLEAEMVSEMFCNSSEDEEGVDCTHAETGSVRLAGRFEVGTSFELEVTGSALIQQLHFRDGPDVACSYRPEFDGAIPHETFESWPERMSPNQDGLERFVWGRRHTAENEVTPVWEVCELEIASHE